MQDLAKEYQTLPPCCYAADGASLAEHLYAAYNRGGDPATAGVNYQGLPCPTWASLTPNIRAKWEATASEAVLALKPEESVE